MIKRILCPIGLVFFILISFNVVSYSQSPAQTYWWNDAVFYEVFVRSFKDSDGDGKGDLKGLIDKLDYLNDGDPNTNTDLGVTALWLMPIMESPSYHGYDVTDYRAIEQDYGTNQDFADLITKAHNRGIKVIIDYVMNHTSSQHSWFQSSTDPLSTKRDWYVWQSSNPGGTGPWGQQVWYSKSGSYYYGIFWSEMPDLNYNTQEVKDEMFDVVRFWLEDMNVDGFRLDAARYIIENGTNLQDTDETIQFWEDFRIYYKSIDTDAFAVGEAWAATDISKGYVSDTTLDYCFEFDLASAIVNTANTGNTSGLQTQIDKVIASYPLLQYGTFLTNHDMNRVMYQLGQNTSKAKVAADLLLTLPGVPYIYYGEEIGMIGNGADENKRTPLQWSNSSQAGFTTGTPWRAVNSDYTGKNILSQQYDNTSLWHHYKNLISTRNRQEALRKGTYKTITSASSGVFAFLRQYNSENIIVVSNTGSGTLSDVQITLSPGSITQGSYTFVELRGGDQLPVTIDNTGGFTNLSIGTMPPQSTYIYKLMDPAAITTSVTFQIDMNTLIDAGDFIPGTESVDIVADFNNFGTTLTTLTDSDNDGIYETTVAMDMGNKVNYKYRINGVNDGREEFSNSSYLREYLVPEGVSTIVDVYQKLDITTGVSKPSQLNVAIYPMPVDQELFINYSLDFTGIMNYRITDLVGVEKVSSSFVSSSKAGQYILQCEGLPLGIYLLTLECDGTSETYRIVVRR